MGKRQTLFADILLPLPVKGCFTYRIPLDLNEQITTGQRVVVPFGRNKVYAGLVKRIHESPPKDFQARYVQSVLDTLPVVTGKQFAFWEWMSAYYLCTEGEVMGAALPPAMKLAGETRIALNPSASSRPATPNEMEQLLLDALKTKKQMTLSEAATSVSIPKVLPLVKNMIEKGWVVLKEDLENPWRPKVVRHIRLAEPFRDEKKLRDVFDQCEKQAPRQLEVLMKYIQLAEPLGKQPKEVSQQEVTSAVKGGLPALQSLVKKGVFETWEKEKSYFDHSHASGKDVVLNEHQQKALQSIKEGFKKHNVVLLHGVTSSGKTELYIKLIRETIAAGKQVLYLLPEIALTTQIINRLQQQFGNRAGIYHSRFNPVERTEVWNNLVQGGILSGNEKIRYDLVLGPRSALFLPFQSLGLIIVDEEHETGFKQHDPAPRYHARDAAIYLASLFGAKTLLGSATPSLETYYNTRHGKYGYARIDARHGGSTMPQILVSDLRKETRSKAMKSHFSPLLFESIKKALEEKEQVILFQNRRGFSPRLECDICSWLPECHQCDVTLVYHKQNNKLRCHYCGYNIPPPAECPSCTSSALKMKGFGTEKIEEELPLFFPGATIARMDTDTTRSKNAYRHLIDDFEKRRTDILVGTQMISKGLDFSNVGVVGILNADNMLNFPDFRAHERAFQLMAQVSGRAGRSRKQGRVIIQSYHPRHPIIQYVISNDYEEMYRQQIGERRQFHYPPYTRLVKVTAMHSDTDLLNDAASVLTGQIRKAFPGKVLGPEYPVIARIRNQYIKNTLIKFDRSLRLAKEKQLLLDIARDFQKERQWKPIRIIFNTDPL